jgi:hypothetical protein
MKKVLSTLVAAIVAISFAGIVCAAEPVVTDSKTTTETTAPAGDVVKTKKTVKKTHKKVKKAKKAPKVEETTTTTTEPAPAAK